MPVHLSVLNACHVMSINYFSQIPTKLLCSVNYSDGHDDLFEALSRAHLSEFDATYYLRACLKSCGKEAHALYRNRRER